MVDDDDDDKFAFLFCNTSYKTQIGSADCYVFYTRMIDAKRERRTEKKIDLHTRLKHERRCFFSSSNGYNQN